MHTSQQHTATHCNTPLMTHTCTCGHCQVQERRRPHLYMCVLFHEPTLYDMTHLSYLANPHCNTHIHCNSLQHTATHLSHIHRWALSGSRDKTLRVFDVQLGQCVQVPHVYDSFMCVAWLVYMCDMDLFTCVFFLMFSGGSACRCLVHM